MPTGVDFSCLSFEHAVDPHGQLIVAGAMRGSVYGHVWALEGSMICRAAANALVGRHQMPVGGRHLILFKSKIEPSCGATPKALMRQHPMLEEQHPMLEEQHPMLEEQHQMPFQGNMTCLWNPILLALKGHHQMPYNASVCVQHKGRPNMP